MFFVFRDDEEGICRFDKVVFWNIPNSIVDGPIKTMYEKCAEIIKTGNVIMDVSFDGRVKDNFPKESDSRVEMVCYVRPHGVNSKDTFVLRFLICSLEEQNIQNNAFGLINYLLNTRRR